MSLSLSLFLYVYFVFLAVWSVFSGIGLYHLFKFGYKTITTVLAIVLFIGLSAIIFFYSYQFIVAIDWQTDIVVAPWIIPNNPQFN
jgi:hypothetical protein